jgi:heavy metal translocating P-type ATPase
MSENCCCEVRREQSTPSGNGAAYGRFCEIYERLEIFLLIISGVSLVASFFHLLHGVVPFDPAWVSIIISGTPFFVNAISNIVFKGRISVDTLLSVAITATIISEWFFPASAKATEGGHVHSYIFAGGEVAFIMALGHYLEEWTISKARSGIEALLKLAPKTARKIDNAIKNTDLTTTPETDSHFSENVTNNTESNANNIEKIIAAEEVKSGDLLRVLPGESIPVDGIIVEGNTSIDQSLITGESLPVDLFVGDAVYGGTVNRFGSFVMRATRVGEDASIANMIRLVREAEQKKASVERIADSWASFLVPMAIITAVIIGFASFAIGYFWYGSSIDFQVLLEGSVSRAVTILVVFCPCSLVLATPTAIIAAIGNASRGGILIRSGEVLEQLALINTVAFDKTGTLTIGEPCVKYVYSCNDNYIGMDLLKIAASVELLSEHPLAKAIVEAARSKNVQLDSMGEFEMFRGEGIRAMSEKYRKHIIVGNGRILSRFNIKINDEHKNKADVRYDLGETVIWVVLGKEVIGFVSVSDEIRPISRVVVEILKSNKIDVILLTGDNQRAAKGISEIAGITSVKANLLPEDKVREIETIVENGGKVAMIGDGINDAPALKSATVGIAMGKIGSDLTIDAADVVLMGDDLLKILSALNLARRTRKKIIGNILLSMCINVIAIFLATFGLIGPVVGALVHNAGSVAVVLNASTLLKTEGITKESIRKALSK